MRIAFYAPLKPPTHPVPSGDRRVARLLIDALERAGNEVEVVSTLRSYEGEGDAERQLAIRAEGAAQAKDLIARWRANPAALPDIWFTYHVYYKAPDWLGPEVTAALGIPYVIAEASYAPKRARGAWKLGHEATGAAVGAAALVLCPIRDDIACLEPLSAARNRIRLLAPFLDPGAYVAASHHRMERRERLASELGIDPGMPWIVVAAMMRPGDKLLSYRKLAVALGRLSDVPWQALIAGDGTERAEVERLLRAAAPGRTTFLGERQGDDLAGIYAACDLCVWPSVNEAYGMAMLEAQAAGVPVVSQAVRGVPDVVRHGVTGLLSAKDDDEGMAQLARQLLQDPTRRIRMGRYAARYVSSERSVDAAAHTLRQVLTEIMLERSPTPARANS